MSQIIDIYEGTIAPVKFGPFESHDLTDWTVYVYAYNENDLSQKWKVAETIGLAKNQKYAPEGDFSAIPAGTDVGFEIWAENSDQTKKLVLAPNPDTDKPLRGYIRNAITF